MRLFLWMGIILLCMTALANDTNRDYIPEDTVDWFEINHCYNKAGMIKFDQVILWEWRDFLYGNKREKVAVVVAWYNLPHKENREKFTPDEYRVRNAEFRDQWVKDKKQGKAPDYVPKFIYTNKCPRYDAYRGKWVVISYLKGTMRKIYATNCIESWTQYDPETLNQKTLPGDRRRGLRRVR